MNKKMIIWSLVFLLSSCNICWINFETKAEKDRKIEMNKQENLKKLFIEKKNKIFNLDYKSDKSITKYVDNKIHYGKVDYVPDNLVKLKWDFLIDKKGNQKVRKITLENLDKLSKSFYDTFWKKLEVVSAYRAYSYQKGIKDRGCPDIFCAKAGFSEHQSGLAVDFWEASTQSRFEKNEKLKTYFDWMKDNWYKYGFTNSYQNWAKIDWYSVEPWHWRYVWVELATYFKKDKMTFWEFYYKNIKK